MSTETPRGRLFTTREAAEYLGMPFRRLQHLVWKHDIAVVRYGRIGIYQTDCDEWVERRRQAAAAPAPRLRRKAPTVVVRETDRRSTTVAKGIADLMPTKRRFAAI